MVLPAGTVACGSNQLLVIRFPLTVLGKQKSLRSVTLSPITRQNLATRRGSLKLLGIRPRFSTRSFKPPGTMRSYCQIVAPDSPQFTVIDITDSPSPPVLPPMRTAASFPPVVPESPDAQSDQGRQDTTAALLPLPALSLTTPLLPDHHPLSHTHTPPSPPLLPPGLSISRPRRAPATGGISSAYRAHTQSQQHETQAGSAT